MPAPTSVAAYLAALPEDRRAALTKVRAVIKKNLPKGYEEGIQYGMIGYYVPHSIYPAGYHANPKEPLPFVHLASQKGHMAVYLMCVYGDQKLATWFAEAYAKTGKRLDFGKSCLRFKKLEDLAVDVIGQVIAKVPVAEYVKRHEMVISTKRPKAKPAAAKAKPAAAKAKPAVKAKASVKAKPAAKPKATAAKPKKRLRRTGRRSDRRLHHPYIAVEPEARPLSRRREREQRHPDDRRVLLQLAVEPRQPRKILSSAPVL